MKYFKFVCYSLLLMLLFNTSSLYAAPPLDHTTHTPLSLMPEPLSGSHDTFSLAATWWLPDWQGSQGSRGSNDIGGGDIVKDDSDCMKHYNLYATCPSPKVSTGIVHPVAGMTYQKGCICPSEYQYTSSNCSGEYQPSGGSCDGKYNTCSPKPCSSGGYYAEQQTERICSAVTYGGRTCYACYQPQCSAGGYETANKTGYRCAAVAYYGRTCYSCKNDTCTSGYSKSPCGSNHHQTGTAKTEAGSTCYACAAHSYSCPSGYQSSSCSSSQVQTGTTAKVCSCGATSGTCYKCRAKTCAEQGKKECNGSCISTSECCGGCPSGQKCNNGTCINTDPCANVTAVSIPAYAHCEGYCGSKCIIWACNTGYLKVNNGCIFSSSSGGGAASKDPCEAQCRTTYERDKLNCGSNTNCIQGMENQYYSCLAGC